MTESDHGRDDESNHDRIRAAAHLMNLSTDVTTEDATTVFDSRAFRVVATVAALSAATLLNLWRQRGVPVWNSLWAEDGRVFLSDAIRDFPGTFFDQNGGYIHVVPRLIAGVVAQFPVEDAAAGMAVGAAVVVTLVAAFVYFASSEVLGTRLARLGLSAAVVLLPVPGSELLANATNLHFYLLFACFWAFIWQAETPLPLGFRSLVVFAAALSDPLTALFLPLAIVAPIVRRSRAAVAVAVVFVAGLVIQLAIISGGARPERNWGFRLGALPEIFSLRVAGGLLVGDRFLGDAWDAYGRAFAYGASAFVALVIAILLAHSDRRTAAFALIGLGYAGLFFCVQLVGRGTGGMDPEWHGFQLNGSRYVLLPFLLLVAVILSLLESPAVHLKPRTRTWLRRTGLLWLAALLVVNYSVTSDRSRGPRWDRELSQARRLCVSTDRRAASVLVAPSPPRVWFAKIPCRRL